MSSPLRQTNFLGGEFNPMFYGRTDLPSYAKGLRTMRNFFPSKYGSAVSRPGSLFIRATKNPSDAYPRLIPFVYSDTEAYALEFGPGYIRFHRNGATLLDLAGNPYEKTTSYIGPHLRALKYAQTGDVLTITRNSYAAMELRRMPDWTGPAIDEVFARAAAAGQQAAIDYTTAHPDASAYAAADVLDSSSTVHNAIYVQAWWPAYAIAARNVYIAAFRAVWVAEDDATAENLARIEGEAAVAAVTPVSSVNFHTGSYAAAYHAEFLLRATGAPHWKFTPVLFAPPLPYYGGTNGSYPVLFSPLPTPTAAKPAVEWIWLGTQMVQETATGRIFETLPFRISASWDGVAGTPPVALANNKVACHPDLPVKIVRGTHLDTLVPTVNAVNQTFRVIEDRYYRGRGDPTGKGIGLFGFVGSTTTAEFIDLGAEPNYAIQPPRGTNPFLSYDYAGALATTESPFTVAFFQNKRVFGGTYLRPFTLFLSATDQWTNFDRHVIQIAGESILFDLAARRFESMVHLVPHEKLLVGTRSSIWRVGGADGSPIDFNSIDAKMIDESGCTDVTPLIVDGAVLFVRAKGGGVRAIRSDAGENYRGADISDISDHLFVGNGIGFAVYGATKAIVDWTFAEDPFGLVWAVREDGMLLSLTFRKGEAAWARHDGATLGGLPARYQSVCAIPEGDEDAVYVIVKRALGATAGHPMTSLGGGWTTCVERMTSRVRRQAAADDCCVDCAVKYDGPLVDTFTGLSHLEGEEVYLVAVGNPPMGPFTVTGGEITLTDALVANNGAGQVIAYIGLVYVCDLEPLDVATTDARMKQKTVVAAGIETNETRGMLVGRTFTSDLKPVQRRDVVASYSAPNPESKLYRPNVPGTWDETGRFVIRQSLPLPVTITAITREVEMGER